MANIVVFSLLIISPNLAISIESRQFPQYIAKLNIFISF